MNWFGLGKTQPPVDGEHEYVRHCTKCKKSPTMVVSEGKYAMECSCGSSTEFFDSLSEAKTAWNNGWRFGGK